MEIEIPTARPADADDTEITSEIAIMVSASILVFVTTILRYLGRWVLRSRLHAGKGRIGDKIWGWDDCKSIISQGPQTAPFFVSNVR
jgi:hypothetical protein